MLCANLGSSRRLSWVTVQSDHDNFHPTIDAIWPPFYVVNVTIIFGVHVQAFLKTSNQRPAHCGGQDEEKGKKGSAALESEGDSGPSTDKELALSEPFISR